MAQGFWKGLLHGAVISVAGLVGLSLLTPVPDDVAEDEAIMPEAGNSAPELHVAPDDEPPVMPDPAVPDEVASDTTEDLANPASPEESPSVKVETSDSTADSQGPQAAAVDLPVGSEFGRGDDMAPTMPAPMVSDTQSRQTDAPAVSAPTAEPAPVAITDPGVQPAADLPDTGLTSTQEPQTDDTPNPDLPVVLEVPRVMSAPEMIGGAAPDQAPEITSVIADEGAQSEGQKDPGDVIVTPVEAETPDDVSVSPALPQPGLDLSTPPDLSDLRVLQE